MEMDNIIEVKDLTRNYEYGKKDKQVVRVLKGIDFFVRPGEFASVMGKSGCGKTTLLKILGLIDRPTSGKVLFKGTDVSQLCIDEVADLKRREIGFVFQDFNLMDSLTVRENILLPQILDKQTVENAERQAGLYIEILNLTHLLNKRPYSLSAGEKQRTAICRALMNNPSLLLADEPTGNLDSKSGEYVMEIFKSVNEKLGIAILMVTHDIKIASYSNRVVFLKDGGRYKELEKSDEVDFLNQISQTMLEL